MAAVVQKENQCNWIRYIKQRIERNKNFIGFVGGSPGSGKSWSCLSIAEQLNPGFDIKNVVFHPSDLMARINSGELKSGGVIIFEEAGVSISNKNWQSTMNKILNFLFQTFRHKRYVLIMNSPYMDFIDASTRKLFHAEFKTLRIDMKEKTVMVKPQIIQYNDRQNKFYYKYLRVITGPGSRSPVKTWVIPKPSDALVDAYEAKKTEFTTKLNREIEEQLKKEKVLKKNRKYSCQNCNHLWIPHGEYPNQCPKCHKTSVVEVSA